MRIALISALKRTETGELRAELPLAGRSILAWQVDLLAALGAERVICLCHAVEGEVLSLQHKVEASGATFHALTGFVGLAALVRAEDDLLILGDGLLPDQLLAQDLVKTDAAWRRAVICLPADHTMVASSPNDFERIDAARHWAGLLVMRGAPVQHLATFPDDADAVSLLLRLALQARTPCHDLGPAQLEPGALVLADSAAVVATHQRDMMARAVRPRDLRTPMIALADALVGALAPRGLRHGTLVAGSLALVLALGGVVAAAFGAAGIGLGCAAAAAFSGTIAAGYAGLAQGLQRRSEPIPGEAAIRIALDALAALTLWFALAPLPEWTALAVCGPLLIGLARLAAREDAKVALSGFWQDRACLLVVLTIAAATGFVSDAIGIISATALGALLLAKRGH
jgi:hypothetical protein